MCGAIVWDSTGSDTFFGKYYKSLQNKEEYADFN